MEAEANPGLRTFPDPAPSLSPTSLPVGSDLSYHNKGKNAQNKYYIYNTRYINKTLCSGQGLVMYLLEKQM